MGWSFRKSKSFGPFRVNLSKSGVGFSFGVKGARISTSRRGTYVTLGAGGISYRQKLSPSSFRPTEPIQEPAPGDGLHTITSADFDNLTDADSRKFVDDLEEVEKKISLFKWLGAMPGCLLILVFVIYMNKVELVSEQVRTEFEIVKGVINVREKPSTEALAIAGAYRGQKFKLLRADSAGWVKVETGSGSIGYIRSDLGTVKPVAVEKNYQKEYQKNPWLRWILILLIVLAIVWCIFLYNKDKLRKAIEIYYTMDEPQERLHKEFLSRFAEFASSRKIWQVLHEERVKGDRKYFAGASNLIRRVTVQKVSNHKLPSWFLKTNVMVPHIGLRNTGLYFFPERLVLKRGNTFAAVFYKNLEVQSTTTRFIEDGPVPSDATVVDHTWKYVNKSGGPDRRFNNNYQIPICNYSEYSFQSDAGIYETISTSRVGSMDAFAEFISAIGKLQTQIA